MTFARNKSNASFLSIDLYQFSHQSVRVDQESYYINTSVVTILYEENTGKIFPRSYRLLQGGYVIIYSVFNH